MRLLVIVMGVFWVVVAFFGPVDSSSDEKDGRE